MNFNKFQLVLEIALILTLVLIIIIIYLSRHTLRKKLSPEDKKYYTIDDKFNSEKREREIEIDTLLGKMGQNGVDDLSSKDRKRLKELSKKIK